ncbi:MAG: Uma2 family endonuclease [Gemmataceae bacterium]
MKHGIPSPDPFRFGWRYQGQIDPDGSKKSVQAPLTLDDVLHPQEGDRIPDKSQQSRDCNYFYGVLEWRLEGNPHAVEFNDCPINWGVPGLRNHSPDISVFDGVNDPERNWKTFSVAVVGARPLLVIEIVSPDAHEQQARDNDVVIKVGEYYRAGVPLYVIVDQEREGNSRQPIDYRRGARNYLRMRPDRQGRLLLTPVRLLLGLREERVVCWDADNGEEIGNLTATAQALRAAQDARETEAHAPRSHRGGIGRSAGTHPRVGSPTPPRCKPARLKIMAFHAVPFSDPLLRIPK